MRCEHNLYFLWDGFRHIGDSQFLEIVSTSKEIMSFHDHGGVVFRFGRSRNDLPIMIIDYRALVLLSH